jgi:hypothetical protein
VPDPAVPDPAASDPAASDPAVPAGTLTDPPEPVQQGSTP